MGKMPEWQKAARKIWRASPDTTQLSFSGEPRCWRTDRHENRKFSVRTPRSANVLRLERSASERRSAAAVRAPTPEGAPIDAGFTAASEALGWIQRRQLFES
jgi:hypothetical protein